MKPDIDAAAFAAALIEWQQHHGRHDLPWQQNPSAYRVWVSEIMLQQTQVSTVIPYYQRFMQRFPVLTELAKADLDEVLQYWSGLGYYARARNLHRAAQQAMQQYSGHLPRQPQQLESLPGIGRSTAAAILSFSDQQPLAILDGNVKRVLSRVACVDGWPGSSTVLKQLWQLSEQLTPRHNTAVYNQAMMDLGSSLCGRGQPACKLCPLKPFCCAVKQGDPARYPGRKPKAGQRRQQRCCMLLRHSDHRGVLLYKRPPTGIWGGLWSLPQYDTKAGMLEREQLEAAEIEALPVLEHRFSHFDLLIEPYYCRGDADSRPTSGVAENEETSFWQLDSKLGLPAPVKKLLMSLDWAVAAKAND